MYYSTTLGCLGKGGGRGDERRNTAEEEVERGNDKGE
jgi:hypothetical protein